jgi:membrane-associated phospholipid phosphatase
MKKMRIPLIIAFAVAVIGIIFGSFFDLQISQAIAGSRNMFGLAISAICPTLGFAGVALMGGGFVAIIVKGKNHIALKILFGVLAAACLGVAIFYPAGEYFGENGFYWVAPKWVGYLVVILPECAAMVGGYFLFKDYENDKLWIIFCVIVALLLIALLGVIPLIKDNMHRPRFRLVTSSPDVDFYNWWEPCKDYKGLIETFGLSKEDFKSFPSGHTAETSILLVAATLFPMASKKLQKIQLPVFIGASALILLVAIARILAAAHYLSDVSWSATIVLLLTFIANEVLANIKAVQLKEEEPAPQE